jgi:ElaB/YqjD/DUF883 family membrane-anchored ribosome-binding protein
MTWKIALFKPIAPGCKHYVLNMLIFYICNSTERDLMIKPIPTSVNVQEQLVSDIKTVISEAEEMLGATADQAGEKIANVRNRIQARLKDAKVRLVEAEEVLVAKSKAAARATDDYVRESPWTAVSVAAGAGLLIGLLIGRR